MFVIQRKTDYGQVKKSIGNTSFRVLTICFFEDGEYLNITPYNYLDGYIIDWLILTVNSFYNGYEIEKGFMGNKEKSYVWYK